MATVCFTIYMCTEFYKDNNVSDVQIKTFHEDEQSVYPDVTICFPNRYSARKLRRYGNGITPSTYAKFLDGDLWDYRMINLSLIHI